MTELSYALNLKPPDSLLRRDNRVITDSLLERFSKKRKIGEDTLFSTKPIIVKPYPPAASLKPFSLTPAFLLRRPQLPFSFLDTVPGSSGCLSNPLFTAHIAPLEAEHAAEGATKRAAPILIATADVDKTIYAVELFRTGIYSLCRVKSRIRLADLERCSTSVQQSLPSCVSTRETSADANQWWITAALEGSKKDNQDGRSPKRIRLSMCRPSSFTLLSDKPQDSDRVKGTEGKTEPSAIETEVVEKSPQQLFETLVSQYMEILYLSKTSLAYFAKGPLSRARAAFSSTEENSTMKRYELTIFMRSMLLSLASMDKKYRERLPEIVKGLPVESLSDDEFAAPLPPPEVKKRKSKTIKPNRDGLYPSEQLYIKRWWISDTAESMKAEESAEQRLKRRTGDLRIRETLIQIILVLEIMALEASSSYKIPDLDNIAPESQTQKEEGNPSAKKRKGKKPQDLKLLIDLLLDKLCIWQSIEQDEISARADEPDTIAPSSTPNARHSKVSSVDRLRSFCIEIIVPFYMSKLPDQAALINRKLGGPSAPSPPKRSVTKQSTPKSKPSESDNRAGSSKKSRRSLGRVSTDTMAQLPQHVRSLSRSATDSLIVPGLKREASETPLSAIPFSRSPTRVSSRASVSQYSLLNQRQIDFGAMSAASEAKLKQKAKVEEALKDAISTLKKPNRGLAVKEFVEASEKRSQVTGSRSRKPAITTRRIVPNVQVTATPRKGRKMKDVVSSNTASSSSAAMAQDAYMQPPSEPFIPSSGLRHPDTSYIPSTGLRTAKSTDRLNRGGGVEETPSRGPAKIVTFFSRNSQGMSESMNSPLDTASARGRGQSSLEVPSYHQEMMLPSSPIADRTERKMSSVFETPSKPRHWGPPPGISEKKAANDSVIFATPAKPVSSAVDVNKTIAASTAATPQKNNDTDDNRDIYTALGWDDDLDELC